jgi:hypothetical protein
MLAWQRENKDRVAAASKRYRDKPESQARAREWSKEYEARPEVRARRNEQARDARREKSRSHPHAIALRKIKSGPCVDCGLSFPPAMMEMDHVRGSKSFNVTIVEVVRPHITTEMFEAEVAKCDLRCPNCHRLRHYRNGEWGCTRLVGAP